jgi:hypothetical protein
MRDLVLRLRALQARLNLLTTALGITARIADVFGLGWLVTLLNGAILVMLLILLTLNLVLRALVRKLRKAFKLLCVLAVDAVDVLRQLLKMHLMIAALALFSTEQNYPCNTLINDVSGYIKRSK